VFLIDSGVETGNFVKHHFHLEMRILSVQENPITSYGGSKRGRECEIACVHFFFLDGELERRETLFKALIVSFCRCSYSQNGRIQ
jgi:hypothetical protein